MPACIGSFIKLYIQKEKRHILFYTILKYTTIGILLSKVCPVGCPKEDRRALVEWLTFQQCYPGLLACTTFLWILTAWVMIVIKLDVTLFG